MVSPSGTRKCRNFCIAEVLTESRFIKITLVHTCTIRANPLLPAEEEALYERYLDFLEVAFWRNSEDTEKLLTGGAWAIRQGWARNRASNLCLRIFYVASLARTRNRTGTKLYRRPGQAIQQRGGEYFIQVEPRSNRQAQTIAFSSMTWSKERQILRKQEPNQMRVWKVMHQETMTAWQAASLSRCLTPLALQGQGERGFVGRNATTTWHTHMYTYYDIHRNVRISVHDIHASWEVGAMGTVTALMLCSCIYLHIPAYTCIYLHIPAYTCIYLHIPAYIHKHVHVHTAAYMHIYAHICFVAAAGCRQGGPPHN